MPAEAVLIVLAPLAAAGVLIGLELLSMRWERRRAERNRSAVARRNEKLTKVSGGGGWTRR